MSAVQRWLDSLSPNTRRNYQAALVGFLDSCIAIAGDDDGSLRDTVLRSVKPHKIQWWLNDAQRAGKQPATLNLYRAALASFYRYARAVEGWEIADPLVGIRAHRLSPYGRSRYPTALQVKQLLAAVPADTIAGQRDLAVILGLYVTTRRVSEWVTLRWHNVHQTTDGRYWFAYTAKGGSENRQAIPAFLWQRIEAYLVAAGRWPLPHSHAPLFVRVGKRVPPRSLSAGYVRCIIANYGARAGLPPEVCHPHGLRHAGARARKEAGQTPWEMQGILAHKHLSTTMIYTRQVLEAPADHLGDSIAAGVWPD